MNELLIAKAKKIEQFNLSKAKKIIYNINKYIEERNIENPNEPYILFSKDISLYFEKFKVICESLKDYWMESDENTEWYIEQCDSIVLSLFVNNRESARIELNREDDIVLDDLGLLDLKKGAK